MNSFAQDILDGLHRAIGRETDMATDAERIVPRGDMVLIRRLEKDECTPGGIIIPEVCERHFFKAEVLAVGPGSYGMSGPRQPLTDLKVGDVVLVMEEPPAHSGMRLNFLIPVTESERTIVLCPEGKIVAVERPEGE